MHGVLCQSTAMLGLAVGGDGVVVDLVVQIEEGEQWKAQLIGLLWWLRRELHLSIHNGQGQIFWPGISVSLPG